MGAHNAETELDIRPSYMYGRPEEEKPVPQPVHRTYSLQHPVASGVLDYFPDAIAAVAECSRIGNDQHNPGQPMHWNRDLSTEHGDKLLGHFMRRGTIDSDKVRHSAKVAWRSLALLQEEIENDNNNSGVDLILE